MTNKSLSALIMMMLALTLQGKNTRVIDNPKWLLSDAGKALTVTKIEFYDTATVLSFHSEYKPKEWIRIATESYLTDDDGNKYAARKGMGITLGKRFYMPESGQTDFKVSFEPMPRSTRHIDFIEGPTGWRIWGIHKYETKMPKQKTKNVGDLKITDEQTFFRSGTGVVCGHFEGKKPKILNFYGTDAIHGDDKPQVFDVADDGTFTAVIPVDNPILSYLSDGQKQYYFYIAAGDTLDITISENSTVAYPENHEYARLLRLLSNETPAFRINYTEARRMCDSLTYADYAEWISAQTDSLQTTLEYIAGRYGLSPRETHLLRTKMLLDCGQRFLDFQDNHNINKFYNTDDYTFLRRLNPDDLTAFSLPDDLYIFINRYEFCIPIYFNKEKNNTEHLTLCSAEDAANADRAIFGTDRLSWFLQTAWTYKKRYASQYNINRDIALEQISNRRQQMTSERLKGWLDETTKKLTDPNNKTYTLPDGKATDIFNAIMEKYRGKYVYVDFWGIYCGPCRSGIERSQNLRDSLATAGDIELVFITSDRESPQKKYDEYAAKHLKGEESYRIPEDDMKRLRALFGFNGIPHHELVAPDGSIIEADNIRSMFYSDINAFMKEHEKIKENISKN